MAKHPFQCLVGLRDGSSSIFLACGHQIFKWSLVTHDIESTWNGVDTENKAFISRLALSSDGQFLAAITVEDKSLHLFDAQTLSHLSQRVLLKRPCALSFTPDSNHVLVGDKFGDVYGFSTKPSEADYDVAAPAKASSKVYSPAATELTVHSAKNLKTLENQRKMAARSQAAPEKATFYRPILGHVSMLTDLQCVKISPNSVSALGEESRGIKRGRMYIVTSDRDEHIRITRGLPQAHIIEAFCLGHTQFVSKVCFPRPNLLLSGGGDSWLGLWDWLSGRLLTKIPLEDCLDGLKARNETLRDAGMPWKLGVSGLWPLQSQEDAQSLTLHFLCTFESVNAVVEVLLTLDQDYAIKQHLTVPSMAVENVLDIAIVGSSVLVCTDNIHALKSAQANQDRLSSSSSSGRLQIFDLLQSESNRGTLDFPALREQYITSFTALDGIGTEVKIPSDAADHLAEQLYSIAGLRKGTHDE